MLPCGIPRRNESNTMVVSDTLFIRRNFAIAVALSFVAGCDVAPTTVELQAGHDSARTYGANLDQAQTNFVGGTQQGNKLISSDSLKPKPGKPVELKSSRSLAVSLKSRRDLGSKRQMVRALKVTQGQSRYFLAQGLGIFADPVTIDFQSVAVTPTVGMSYLLYQRNRLGVTAEAGVGGEYTQVYSSVQSALLDVRTPHNQLDGLAYVTGTAAYQVANGVTAQLTASGALYSGGSRQATLHGGLSFDLPK